MKKIIIIALSFAALLSFQSCNSGPGRTEGISKGAADSLSIALAVYYNDIISQNQWTNDVDYNLLFKTMKALKKGKDVGITPMQVNDVVNNYMVKKVAVLGEQNTAFLEKNKTKSGVVELPSGLQYKILEEGAGVKPAATDTVTVHCVGKLIDGTQFESSYDRGEPFTFPLNGVIPGWTEGFQQFTEGTKAILYIPSNLGYGPQPPYGSNIYPNATLIFEVELIKVSITVPQPENEEVK